MRKFNKTLTFRSVENLGPSETKSNSPNSREFEGQQQKNHDGCNQSTSSAGVIMQPLNSKLTGKHAHIHAGLSGIFIPIHNDFSIKLNEDTDELTQGPKIQGTYRDQAHWPSKKREEVKRFRFVICILALFSLALGLMSRLMLNVAIVEMVRRPEEASITRVSVDTNGPESSLDSLFSEDPLLYAANDDGQTTTSQPLDLIVESTTNSEMPTYSTIESSPSSNDDALRFDWSKQDVNIILGSFYFGYMPGILFSGDLAQRFGAKYPLFVCLFGTALINFSTPFIACYSLNMLIGSRVALGLIQGSLMPALYELFNRWLTQTESSIFAPMIKVSMPLGSLVGTLMPGLLAAYKLEWPNLFYIGGLMCLTWSLAWLYLATSMPQTNSFVDRAELYRITRKKGSVATILFGNKAATGAQDVSSSPKQKPTDAKRSKPTRKPTPWLAIVTNPSVLALTLVKFTYNIGLDFIYLQLAVYLREAHQAPIETISMIASSCYAMQMALISFVAWVAKVLVVRRAFGLSVTKWRKVFQGGANFLMAFAYLGLAYFQPGIELASMFVFVIGFFWMLGAGGESMVPYDLSAKFPASIVGLAHSISVASGIALTALIGIVLGESTQEASRWSALFFILAGLLIFGGLVFVCVLKAKPFLPDEKINKPQQSSQPQEFLQAPQREGGRQVTTPGVYK